MPYRDTGFRVREAKRITQSQKKIDALSKVQVGNFEAGDFKSFLNVSPFSRSSRDVVRGLHGKYVARQNVAAQPE